MGLALIHTPSDIDLIACMYYSFKACGRIDDIFDGHDLLWWLDQFNKNESWICEQDGIPVGFGMINTMDASGIRGEVSFGMLPACTGRNAVRFGKMMLEAVFSSNSRLRFVYGTTPSRNEKGIKFGKLIGMRVTGVTPNLLTFHGELDDAVLTYVEREEILGKRTERTSRETE